MYGIVFFASRQYTDVLDFYLRQVGCELWLEQPDCTILRHGNMLFGFCRRDSAETGATITFFYETREEVDVMYGRFAEVAETPPAENPKYGIYNFFARDPEGRSIEFQRFEHAVDVSF